MTPKPKDPVPQDLVNYVEAAMEMQNLSLRTVAEKAGMDPATLSRVLSRQQGIPSDDALVRLGYALNLRNPASLLFYARRVPESDPLFVELLQVATELKREDFRALLTLAKHLRRERKKADTKFRNTTRRTKSPKGAHSIG
jgi:transcriptional regulator with XRE-family HTH domain